MPSLDRLVLEGFKSIQSLDLELGALNVFIGQNGAGKTNLIDFFRLLHELIEQRLQLFVQRSGGASGLLHYGAKRTRRITAELYFDTEGYSAQLGPTGDDGLVFEEEEFLHRPGDEWERLSLGRGHREARAVDEQNDAASFAEYIVPPLRTWTVYHFHDTGSTAAVKQTASIHDNERLRPDAANLAAVLYRLSVTEPGAYMLIRAAVQRVFPRFDDFALRLNPLNLETIRLEWRERGSDYRFGPHQLSDGTLRFICLATLLLSPDLPTTILIDEPELGLHPAALAVLGGLLRSASTRAQLLISTQSVSLLNEFEPEQVVTVDRDRETGASVFRRHSGEELRAWLEEYSLGEIWEMNVIGGRP